MDSLSSFNHLPKSLHSPWLFVHYMGLQASSMHGIMRCSFYFFKFLSYFYFLWGGGMIDSLNPVVLSTLQLFLLLSTISWREGR